MTTPADEGGEAACWSHLLSPDHPDDAARFPALPGHAPIVVDLGAVATDGPGGAVWSLPHGGDLDANLVRLPRQARIAAHVNDEVDVLLFVLAGEGVLVVDGDERQLRGDVVAVVPKGATRAVHATGPGLTYLSVHRRRSPLGIRRQR